MANLLWYLQRLDWIDVLDILIVASIFFWILYLVRGTKAASLLRGVILSAVAVALVGSFIRLRALGWLLKGALPALLVAIPVIFQQELRRAFERLGRASSAWVGQTRRERATLAQTLTAVSTACHLLAERRIGAIIVLERETGLQEFVDTGVLLDAAITPELLITVFNPNTVLHDGAVIIRQGRILAAACVLPLSTAFLADRQLGLRHRAAIGVTEESDAVVVVVSEERGAISIAHNGRIIRNLDTKRLEAVLHALFQPVLEQALPRWMALLRKAFVGRQEP